MPLSEEELRLLEQMERALVEEDPKFASTLRGTSFRRSARRRAIVAGIAFVIGVTILMAGAVLRVSPLGIGGFVVMLLSATVGLTAVRGHAHQAVDAEVGLAVTSPSWTGLRSAGVVGARASDPQHNLNPWPVIAHDHRPTCSTTWSEPASTSLVWART